MKFPDTLIPYFEGHKFHVLVEIFLFVFLAKSSRLKLKEKGVDGRTKVFHCAKEKRVGRHLKRLFLYVQGGVGGPYLRVTHVFTTMQHWGFVMTLELYRWECNCYLQAS